MTLAELDRALRQLRLSGMATALEARLRQAQAERLAPLDLVATLVTDELVRRQDRLLERPLCANEVRASKGLPAGAPCAQLQRLAHDRSARGWQPSVPGPPVGVGCRWRTSRRDAICARVARIAPRVVPSAVPRRAPKALG
jgi:IstB-like ATP binding protein